MKLILMTLVLSVILLFAGCAIFQPRTTGNSIAELPTTGAEAVFQTLKSNNWLFTLSVVGVGAGFFAFLNGSSRGLQFMAACFVVISLIIGVTKYSTIIAIISMVGVVCLMAYSMLVKHKAIKEVVQGVQKAQGQLKERADESMLLNELGSVQSKTTEAIVKKIKGRSIIKELVAAGLSRDEAEARVNKREGNK